MVEIPLWLLVTLIVLSAPGSVLCFLIIMGLIGKASKPRGT
jgi:hypothetical protein